MNVKVFRYAFADSVPFADIESSLLLALVALENLHGESRVRLEAEHAKDPENRRIAIDATTHLGSELNRLFVGFVSREFGPDSFEVECIDERHQEEEKES